MVHDDTDNITFCGYCGLIPEPNPDWSLTAEDVGYMFHEPDNDHLKPFFDPTVNKRGYDKYCEHVDMIWERLGII